MTALPETEPTIWHELAKLLFPMTQRAFLQRFGKEITCQVRMADDGSNRPQFGFQLNKPGLLPTALEREWFGGFVAGYRAAVDLGMDICTPQAEEVAQ